MEIKSYSLWLFGTYPISMHASSMWSSISFLVCADNEGSVTLFKKLVEDFFRL
ncbi:MAG: hypothetical protein IPF59_13900 [Ignavibacteria bacterium]|nr:hypothetical protein [Ignavibacteria bacterium]